MLLTFLIHDEEEMQNLGTQLAHTCMSPLVIYLQGPLGAGKTTFSRGFLRGMGYEGRVKSPTYTLVEHYILPHCNIYHFDLYRIQDPEELELMGIRDYVAKQSSLLIEWPEQGLGLLPQADILCNFSIDGESREVEINGESPAGKKVLEDFCKK